jgi:uncharacterized protein YecE (DUF72 family)
MNRKEFKKWKEDKNKEVKFVKKAYEKISERSNKPISAIDRLTEALSREYARRVDEGIGSYLANIDITV